jgi:NADPH-dependent 2,4-dienoyl-CoA reductase/sulfur reductase-like enzyme
LVIGGGVAGISSALAASQFTKRVDLLSEEDGVYSRPAITSVISGKVRSRKQIEIFHRTDLKRNGVRTYNNVRVEALDVNKKRARSVIRGRRRLVEYERIVIATGSRPLVPRVMNTRLKGAYTVKWTADAVSLSSYALAGRKALVLGGGFVGLEAAEALRNRGLEVTVIEKRANLLPYILDSELAGDVASRALKRHINLILNSTIDEIGGRRKVEWVMLNGQKTRTHIVVFAIGSRPVTDLIADAGIELAPNGAIRTNDCMRTNIADTYAAGDCAETLDLCSGKRLYRPLGTVAVRSGEIAGSNAAGNPLPYHGFLRRQYDNIFGLDILSMGLDAASASDLGIATKVFEIRDRQQPKDVFHRPRCETRMKAIARRNDSVIVGFQMTGLPRYRASYSLPFEDMIRRHVPVTDLVQVGLEASPT